MNGFASWNIGFSVSLKIVSAFSVPTVPGDWHRTAGPVGTREEWHGVR